jgi:hypothetical protein
MSSPAPGTSKPPAPAPAPAPTASTPPPVRPPSDARKRADQARRDANKAWKAVHARLSKTRGSFNSYASSAEEAYKKALTKTPPSDRQFNKATKDWERAGAVEIPAAAHTPEEELTSVRGVAKEWLAAALALFGLFSFTALFFGGETIKVFADQSWLPVGLFAVTALVAIAGVVLCSFFGTRAANGWPPKDTKREDENGKPRRRTTMEKVDDARDDLKYAVLAAGGTVLAIVVALVIVLGTQLAEPAPLQVKVMPKVGDDAITCGTYKSADTKGITVTDKDKKPVTTAWSDIKTVDAVRGC